MRVNYWMISKSVSALIPCDLKRARTSPMPKGPSTTRSGAPLPLLVPLLSPGDPCGAARASRPRRSDPDAAGSTAGRQRRGSTASGYGHLTRSRPQDSASSAAAAQWEPRKPLGATRKPRREAKTSAGPKWGMVMGFGPSWATREFQPFRSVTQADSAQERPQREAGASRREGYGGNVGARARRPTAQQPSHPSRRAVPGLINPEHS